MIVTSIHDACKVLVEHLEEESVKTCRILTYTLWIPPRGKKFFTGGSYVNVRDLLNELENHDVETTVIIGLNTHPDDIAPVAPRYDSIQKWFSTTRFVYCNGIHAKGVVFDDGFALLGSMNITDSTNSEMGIITRLSDADLLDFGKFFEETLSCSRPVLKGYPKKTTKQKIDEWKRERCAQSNPVEE